MNMDDKLLNYYLALKHPEAAQWNGSPACLHTELSTRDYIRKTYSIQSGMQACNVGIGTGDWDDYLGYLLKGKGSLTSLDMDQEICEIFAYRQLREGHPNPSKVVCESIFTTTLPEKSFDLVTLLGSTVRQSGDAHNCLDASMRLLKQGGALMFMTNLKNSPIQWLESYLADRPFYLEGKQVYEDYPEYPFYICTIKKSSIS